MCVFVLAEGDICSFAQQKTHYTSKHEFSTNLFSSSSRSSALKELYEAAAKTPVHLMRQMDRWRRDGHRSSRFFLCTPVLGAKRKKIRNMVDIDIETRMVSYNCLHKTMALTFYISGVMGFSSYRGL